MHVLVTGAGSFIGRFIVEVLSRAGLKITATYYSESRIIQKLRELPNIPHLVQLDLGDKRGFNQLPESIDSVIHIAALADLSECSIQSMLRCNVNGAYNIQEYALSAGARSFIYTSSLSVHGNITVPVVDVTTPIIDPGVYGASKYIGERLLAESSGKLPVVSLRLPGVLGLGVTRPWIPTLLTRFISQEDIEIVNPESKFNNAIHVLDLANFILSLLDKNKIYGFHAFPLGSSGAITIREVAEFIKEATKSQSRIRVNNATRNAFTISSKYAIETFKYEPRDIRDTIRHFIADVL
jgi:nucleoside-diphosphate-sugar epimerase